LTLCAGDNFGTFRVTTGEVGSTGKISESRFFQTGKWQKGQQPDIIYLVEGSSVQKLNSLYNIFLCFMCIKLIWIECFHLAGRGF
jgi:hypothetical protein